MNVKETPWAKGTREAWQSIADAVPALTETEFRLWQRRVDRPGQVPHYPHIHIYPIVLTRFEHQKRENGETVFAQAEPLDEMTLLVAAENAPDARRRAETELKAHGFNPNEWAIGMTRYALPLLAKPGSDDRFQDIVDRITRQKLACEEKIGIARKQLIALSERQEMLSRETIARELIAIAENMIEA